MNESGSDKGTEIEGFDAHGYSPYYERWFDSIRTEPLRFLEIGVCDPRNPGASLKGWYEYFPNAAIYGIDIVDATRFENDRVTTFIGDQSNRDDLARLIDTHGGDFDIVIDDGSHADEHQQVSLEFLLPYVKPSGHYIIEDMQVSPNTVQLLQALRGRSGESVWLRWLKDTVNGAKDVVAGAKDAPKYLSRRSITRLSREIDSLDLHCDNKIAHIVRR